MSSGGVSLLLLILLLQLLLSQSKRTVIITGANRGIGLATTKKLAASNDFTVVMACRSTALAQKALQQNIKQGAENVEVMELDLGDLRSVEAFSKTWGTRQLDVLCCNAGLQLSTGVGGTSDGIRRTKQGFEETVGTNHVGHFHLINLLLPLLSKSNSSSKESKRIVLVGSGVHNPDEPGGNVGSKATLGDMSGLAAGFREPVCMVDGGAFDADKAYKDSKLCNVITAIELARRVSKQRGAKLTVNVMNPGLIPTSGLFRDLNPIFVFIFTLLTRYVFKVAVSEEVGGDRLAFMISSPLIEKVTGGYFSGAPGKEQFEPITPSKEAAKEEVGKKLWTLTEKIIKDTSAKKR